MYHLTKCIALGNTCIEETRAKKVEPPSLQYTCHIAPPTRNEQRATPLSFRFSADKLKTRFAPLSHLISGSFCCYLPKTQRSSLLYKGEGVPRMLWNDGMIYCFIITCCSIHQPYTPTQHWALAVCLQLSGIEVSWSKYTIMTPFLEVSPPSIT